MLVLNVNNSQQMPLRHFNSPHWRMRIQNALLFVKSRFHCIIFIFKNERLSYDQLLASHAEADCLTSKTNKEPHMTSPRLYCYKNKNINNNDDNETPETLPCKTARGGLWDSFELFMVLARDLCYSSSAQSWQSFSFCLVKLSFRCFIFFWVRNNHIWVRSLCI